MNKNLLLEVNNLKTYFETEAGLIRAVDDISFHVKRGETLGIVGESGCGKSMASRSIIQLVPQPKGKIVGGSIKYYKDNSEVIDITSLNPRSKEMRTIRGNEISMIFQEPMTSLNPVYTIGEQIMESVVLHQKVGKKEARERAIDMLNRVGISAPEQRVDEYPHQLSGGMRQRAMIAISLSCSPKFLIADEPTTALDVTIEAQILKLLRDLQSEIGMSILVITHDLGVICEMANRVVVMYTGKIVESASTEEIFYNPKHPYTVGLLKSIPKIGRKERLIPIDGSVPNLLHLPNGCYFAPRCSKAKEICWQEEPPNVKIDDNHSCKCWLY
ncbi:MAG: ABC transporter ATP-binding protein [Halanaerobiales bacterium]